MIRGACHHAAALQCILQVFAFFVLLLQLPLVIKKCILQQQQETTKIS
jgi:hypothetical protein